MASSVIAIDPGPVQSAWVQIREGLPYAFGLVPNGVVRNEVERAQSHGIDAIAIEMICSYGMPVGREVFETCIWIGRFLETSENCHIKRSYLYPRLDVKLHHCHSSKANDSTIRTALIDRFGGKDAAIGSKAKPGPLYRIRQDLWSALAIGLLWWDTVGHPEWSPATCPRKAST